MGISGAVQIIAAPGDVSVGHLESDTSAQLFAERQAVTISQPLVLDITAAGNSPNGNDPNFSLATLPAGTLVNSYYLHFDVVGTPAQGVEVTGSVTWGEQILGLIVGVENGTTIDQSGNSLDLSNSALGAPGTLYGFDPIDLSNLTDSVSLSADRRTITFDWATAGSADNMRIITAATPEPGSIYGLSMLGLLLLRRGRRRGQTEGN
ncbi:MAG TPA: hypothetical protein VGN88_04685 [Phycisphaerae bacterium]|jgi:hypothetical protein